MENMVRSFNVLFAPLVMLLLIVLDYMKGYVDDPLRRRLYMLAIVPTFLAVLSDMLYDTFAGMSGGLAHTVVYASCFFYYLFQVFAYHATNLFIDYQINKDDRRSRKFVLLVVGVTLTHTAVLLFNIGRDFYFVITPENLYISGDLYIIRLAFSYLAVVFAFGNVYISRKNIKKDQIGLILFFIVLTSIGSTLDLILPSAKLVWPCFCSALLFSYFFIIRAEAQIDALTGVSNRRSFEGYLHSITAPSRRKDYGFIMIDLNKFKAINDEHGHLQGDQALKDAAAIIRNCLRKNDFVARYGGDEFLVITSQAEHVHALTERLHGEFARFSQQNDRPYELSISTGCDVYAADSDVRPHDFLAHIDALMYQAKAQHSERRGGGHPH